MSGSSDLRALFAEYASGKISAEQLHALEAALRDDADLRREFIEYLNIDSVLADIAAVSDRELAEIEHAATGLTAGTSAPPVTRTTVGWQTYQVASVTAIAATLLLAVIVSIARSSAEKEPSVAALVAEVDAALTRNGEPWNETELVAGEYRLDRGLLHLQFAGGVMVYVEAPARFDAVNSKKLVLHHGRLSASVPPAGIGFTVETPEAEVVDFGTEFSVDVEGGASEVHVFDGLVRVQSRTADKDKKLSIDLRTAEAVRIEKSRPQPVGIELATDRFIRNFDEPRRGYHRAVKDLSPVATYSMPIREKGLWCEPPEYSGEVFTGEGRRPPHAAGLVGGSLRVLADSAGRGGMAKLGPPLSTGEFTLSVLVYAESRPSGGTVVSNLSAGGGNFALALDDAGLLTATVRTAEGELKSCTATSLLPLQQWCHVTVRADGEQLQLFDRGQLAAATPCSMLQHEGSAPIWFGTDSEGIGLWDGRIDELALFDRALNSEEIGALYQAAERERVKRE